VPVNARFTKVHVIDLGVYTANLRVHAISVGGLERLWQSMGQAAHSGWPAAARSVWDARSDLLRSCIYLPFTPWCVRRGNGWPGAPRRCPNGSGHARPRGSMDTHARHHNTHQYRYGHMGLQASKAALL